MEASLKRTALYDWHVSHGANMVGFGGWSMPLWYPAGAVSEHRVVITHAGMFDTSHMSVISVKGSGAFDVLQRCFTRDLDRSGGGSGAPLAPGNSLFGAFLDGQGNTVDDSVLFRVDDRSFLVIVNAGKGQIISDHIRPHVREGEAEVTDETGRVGKIDLQGPLSPKILTEVLQDGQSVLSDMKYFMFKGHYDETHASATARLTNGAPVLVSRTGYTGEMGFELLVTPERLTAAWELILEKGGPMGLITCGLAARDSLRAGAGLPLSGQDIGPWPFINNPWEFILPLNADRSAFTKSFTGEAVLGLRDTADHTYAFVGPDPRKVAHDESAKVLDEAGAVIGSVLTCVADMSIGFHEGRICSMASSDKPAGFKPRGLICGFVKISKKAKPGDVVVLKDDRRSVKVTIVDDVRPDRTAQARLDEMIR